MNDAAGTMDPCPILLINLPGSTGRLADAQRQFADAGLHFERIDAVDGRRMAPAEIAAHCPDNSDSFYSPLTPGEVGCYLSHLAALRAIVARGLPAAVVFEDDFRLLPGFVPCLRELLALGDGLPDLVKMYGARSRGEVVRRLGCGAALVRSSSPPICSTCTLWTQRGARRMLAASASLRRPVDVQLKHWWEEDLDIHWLAPPTVTDSPEHTPASTIGSRKVVSALGRVRKMRYRWGYAVERECRYAMRHGLAGWARSLMPLPRNARRTP